MEQQRPPCELEQALRALGNGVSPSSTEYPSGVAMRTRMHYTLAKAEVWGRFDNMNTPSAKLLVLVGEKFACVKIVGRATFTSSVDFKTLIQELTQKGFHYFILDLAECVLMDSTFLGVLTGFGLKLNPTQSQCGDGAIELLNANPRITDLLENLGVLHLFKMTQGAVTPTDGVQPLPHNPCEADKETVTRACLEAHQTLMQANPANVAKFKEVTQFLADDLKKLKAG